jgi:hypothetical protein
MTPERGTAVIVPTWNSEKTLAACLQSVRSQSSPPAEVWVVDRFSNDATRSIAERFETKILDLDVGRSHARREGVRHSRSTHLLFLDSDQVLSPEVVASCESACESRGAGAVSIAERDEVTGPWGECRKIDREWFTSNRLAYPRYFARTAYESVGGHSVRFEDYMEDRDLALRVHAAGIRVAESAGTITNLMGRLRPFRVGIKGARTARDSAGYYTVSRGSRESVMSVITPRVRNILNPPPGTSHSTLAIVGMIAYVPLAYGPRLLFALGGQLLRASNRPSRA